MQFSFGKGLLRAAMSLGFLGGLIAHGSLFSEAATNEPLTVTTETLTDASGVNPGFCGSRFANPSTCEGGASCFNGFESTRTDPAEIGLPDEFGIAFEDEDSIEMFRFDIQQRTFGIDRAVIGPQVVSKVARKTRPNISPPLLV